MAIDRNLEYVRHAYLVPAYKDVRVSIRDNGGVITGAHTGRIMVLFDGKKKAAPCHPTWEVTYHVETRFVKDLDGLCEGEDQGPEVSSVEEIQ